MANPLASSIYENASMSNFIPSGEMTVTDMRQLKEKAVQVGMDRAFFKKLGAKGADLTVREIRPSIDLPTTFAAGDRWIFPAPAAAVAAAFTTTNWINERVPQNTILVFYGAAFESANPEVSELIFRSGPGGAGRTAAIYNVESCYAKMESDGYFSMPIYYDPQELCFIQVINRIPIAVAGTRLILRGYAIEPRQEMIS